MDDVVIIYPISTFTIGFVIITPILLFLLGVQTLLDFMNDYLNIILIVLAVAAFILSAVLVIINKNPLFFVSAVVAVSQIFFYLVRGLKLINLRPMSGFGYIGTLVIFALWIIYGAVNIVVTYGSLSFGLWDGFEPIEKKDKFFVISLGSIIGAIGWLINWFIFSL